VDKKNGILAKIAMKNKQSHEFAARKRFTDFEKMDKVGRTSLSNFN